MENLIQQKLSQIEKDYNIEILYAVESGSRAWGFDSKDSDWDVRFIYKPKITHYLQVHTPQDTVTIIDGDLDFVGWELKKTLGLLYKGNTQLLEWLISPQVYRDDLSATQELKSLAEGFYKRKKAIYHYVNMATNNYYSYIRHKSEVKQKKYLYILRPLLACNWLAEKGTMPPMEIEKTLELVKDQYIHPHICNLLDLKRSGTEMGMIFPVKEIDEYIEFQLGYFKKYAEDLPDEPECSIKELDNYLQKQVLK